jgi:hypothetical protein
MGEEEYLKNQCQQAKVGMRLAFRGLKRDVSMSADPRTWARLHPWASIAAAFAAGFAVTKIVEHEIEAPQTPAPPKRKTAPANQEDPSPATHRGRMATLLALAGKIWSLAQPLIRAAMIAQMTHAESPEQSAPAA